MVIVYVLVQLLLPYTCVGYFTILLQHLAVGLFACLSVCLYCGNSTLNDLRYSIHNLCSCQMCECICFGWTPKKRAIHNAQHTTMEKFTENQLRKEKRTETTQFLPMWRCDHVHLVWFFVIVARYLQEPKHFTKSLVYTVEPLGFVKLAAKANAESERNWKETKRKSSAPFCTQQIKQVT